MPVLPDVVLARLTGVMRGIGVMPVSYMSMMPRRLVIAALVLLRSGAMMLRRVFVVLSRFAMMLGCFFRHGSPLELKQVRC